MNYPNPVAELTTLLEEESALLAANATATHQNFVDRKLRLLRPLLGLPRPAKDDAASLQELEILRKALQRNERLLAIHLGAVRSVASVIIDSIRAAESDCTYEKAAFRRTSPSC